VEGLEPERVRLYVDLALSSLNEVAREALEALMRNGNYEYQSDFARRYVAQGREEGRQEGRQEGLQEGLQRGEVEALFEVLDARGLEVDEAAREQIRACTELSQLKLWLRKAATAESVQELFDPTSAPKPPARKVSQRGRSTKPGKSPSRR